MTTAGKKTKQAMTGELQSLRSRVRALERELALDQSVGSGDAAPEWGEERLRIALEGADAGLWDMRLDTREAVYTDNMFTMLGYDPHELPNTPDAFDDLIHPDDREGVFERTRCVKRGDQDHYDALFRAQAKTGEWRWIRSRGRSVERDAERRAVRVVGINMDVTKQQEIERLARLSHHSIENVNEAIFWVAENGRFRHVNESAHQVLGYTREELLELSVFDLDPHLTKERWTEVWELMKAGNSHRSLGDQLRKDRSAVLLELNLHHVSFEEEELVFAVGRDVTEREEAEENIRRSEEELSIRNRIAEIFLTVADDRMYADVLDVVLEVLKSSHGVFGYLDQEGALVCPSMTRDVWDQCEIPGKDITFPPDGCGSSFWGRAIHEKKPQSASASLRVPEGHIPMRRALAVPIVHGDESQGILSVANKETDYTEDDRSRLEAIADFVAPVLAARLDRDRIEKQRRCAEEELRKSHDDLARAQRIAHMGSYRVDFRTGERTWSDEWRAILDTGDQEPSHELYQSRVHPKDSARVEEAVRQTLAGKQMFPIEYRIRRPDGEIRHVYDDSIVERDNEGEPRRMIGIILDVTDQKLTSEELRNSRNDLARAQRLAHIGSYWRDLRTHERSWSDELHAILGTESEEPSRDLFLSRVHPDDVEMLQKAARDAIAGKESFPLEYRIVRPDGSIRHVYDETEIEHEADGEPARMFGVLFDITDQKRATEELKESRNDLARAQRLAHIGSYWRDLRSNERSWSDELLSILDTGEEKPSKELYLSRVHPDDRETVQRASRDALNGKQSFPLQYRIVRRDGSVRHVHDETKIEFDSSGEPTRMFGVLLDVTEREHTMEELRRSREYLLQTQRLARMGTYSVDLRNDSRIWSEEMCTILGIGDEEPSRELYVSLVHPEDREKEAQAIQEAFRSGESCQIEYRIQRPDGTVRYVFEETKVERGTDDKHHRWFGIIFDVTDRKLAEEELAERLRFETYLSELSATLADLGDKDLSEEMERWLHRLNELLDVDFSLLWHATEGDQINRIRSIRSSGMPTPPDPTALSKVTWYLEKTRAGETVILEDVEAQIPSWAGPELEVISEAGIRSALSVPLAMAGEVLGALAIVSSRRKRSWSDELVQRIKLIGGLFTDALQRQRTARELRFRQEFESLVASLATRFINIPFDETDTTIDHALAEIGKLMEADSCYVDLVRDGGEYLDNAYEWGREGFSIKLPNMQGIPIANYYWATDSLNRGVPVAIPDVAELPGDAGRLKEFLLSIDVGSVVMVPLSVGGNWIGWLGFDSADTRKEWPASTTAVLQVVGEMIAGAIDRKRADEALRRSERNYREIFNAANDPFSIHPPDSATFLDANDKMCDLLGYEREELKGLHVGQVSVGRLPFSAHNADEWIVRASKEGPQLFEWIGRDRNGREIWTEVNLKNAVIGEEPRVLAVLRDITERKKAEEELRSRQAKLESIFRAAPVGICVVSNRIFLEANERLCEITGYDLEELLGQHVRMLYETDEEYERVGRERCEELGERGTGTIETQFQRKDGSIIDVLVSSTYLNPEDPAAGVTFTALDVTERNRAERARRKEKERAQLYLDIAGVVLLALDRSGRVTLINRKGCELLGYSESELVGKDWFGLCVPKEGRKEVRRLFDKFIAEDREPLEYYENNVLTRAGTVRFMAWHNTVIRDENGKVLSLLCSGEDITERKVAEEALQESELRYRSLFDDALDMIHIIDTDGRIVDANRIELETLGYSAEEFIGKPILDFIHSAHREAARRRIAEVSSGSSIGASELALVTKSGEVIDTEISATPQFKDGKVVAARAIIRDIRQRKQDEESLVRSEQRFRSLVEQTSESIFCYEYDPPIPVDASVEEQVRLLYDGVLVECNDVCARSHGATTAEEVIGARLIDLLGITRGANDDGYRRFIDGGYRMIDSEESSRLPDGSRRYTLYNAHGVIDNDRLVRVWGAYRDISDLKRSEEKLRESELRFRTLVEQAADAFCLTTTDGRIVDVNHRTCSSLGYTRGELLAMSTADVYPVFESNQVKSLAELVLGQSATIEGIAHRKDGSVFPVEIRVGSLELDDQRYLVSLTRDISERLRMQETMIQTEKMMTVGGLAAGMAHEINNPLSGVLQGIQNTIRRVTPGIDANDKIAAECGVDLNAMHEYLEQREVFTFLAGIQHAGSRAARIVRNMLQFSRPGSTERTPVDLADMLNRTLDLASSDFDLKKKYDFRDIRIEREFDRTLDKVPCVMTELEQVVLNIVKNAAEAMSESGDHVKQRTLVMRTLRDDSWARIDIEDNGPGMDEETRRRIFEPFFTTKEIGSGTGLGLSVSYFIITNNHRGTIDVESVRGKGTKFVIRIPLR